MNLANDGARLLASLMGEPAEAHFADSTRELRSELQALNPQVKENEKGDQTRDFNVKE